MNKVHVKLLVMAAFASLFLSNSIVAQENPYSPKAILPPAPKATHVQITKGPELEMARTDWAIIRGARTSITESCILALIPTNLIRQRNIPFT